MDIDYNKNKLMYCPKTHTMFSYKPINFDHQLSYYQLLCDSIADNISKQQQICGKEQSSVTLGLGRLCLMHASCLSDGGEAASCCCLIYSPFFKKRNWPNSGQGFAQIKRIEHEDRIWNSRDFKNGSICSFNC